MVLEEAHERVLPLERLATRPRRPVVRPLERDPVRTPAVGAEVVVQALAAPVVVRLPRVQRDLDEDRRLPARRRPDDDVGDCRSARLGSVREQEFDQVVAADGVFRHRQRVRDGPAGVEPSRAEVRGRHGPRGALLGGGAARQARDATGAQAAVPAEPIDDDAVAGLRLRAHVQVHHAARQHARLGRVALDRTAGRRRRQPVHGPALRVLGRDRIGCGRDAGHQRGEVDEERHAAPG